MDERTSEDHETPRAQPMSCPKCGSTDVRRARSDGFLVGFFQMFGRWPFRCRSCRVRFFRYAPPPAD